jgi:putative ABC transport system permease protein
MKTPFLKGRDFTEHDDTNAPPVMIVDETFARILKLGSDPIGRRLFVGDGTENVEIIGLVRDVKKVDMAGAMRGEMYRSYRQMCWGYQTIVVRTQRDPMDLTRAVRRELDRLDKDLPMERVWTMSQLVAANVSQRRLSVQLLTGFAVGALLLSALGLYGVLAYMVGQRTREIGVRMALGAQRASVLRLIIGQGLKLGLAGLLIGLAGAWALTRVLERLLYEIKPNDPWTFGCVAAVLAVVAVLACWLPARRATRIEPIEALRRDF